MMVFNHILPTYNDVLARANALSVTVPSYTQILKQNGVHFRIQRQALWTSLNIFYIGANDGSEGFARINHKNPTSFTLTIVSTTLWLSNQGLLSNGSSGYYNTNWNPSTNGGSTFTQNNHSFYVYRFLNTTSGNVDFGGVSGGTGVRIRTSNVAEGAPRIASSSGEFSMGVLASWNGGFQVVRTASGSVDTYYNGSFVVNNSTVTVALPNLNMYINASNTAGTASAFQSVSYISAVFAGSNSLTPSVMHDIIDDYIQSL